jgi:hypothetical protein
MRIPIALCGLVAFFAMFFAFPMEADAQSGELPTYDLRAAVRTVVEGHGLPYAGICDEINQPANAGKYCATIREETQLKATVTVGLVGSSQPYTITFQNGIAGWSLASHNLPQQAPGDLRVAIQKLVESRGFGYSGLCNEFVPPREPGVFCGTVNSLDANTAVVTVGALSGSQYQATFVRSSGAWVVNWHTLPVNVDSGIRAAVKSVIEGRLYSYAGLCNEIVASSYPGYWCAVPQSVGTDFAQFAVGPVGGNATYQLTLVRKNGQWTTSAHNMPLNIPTDLRAALRSLVEGRGFAFAGLCPEIEQVRYPGQMCAFVESLSTSGAQFSVRGIGTTNSYTATFIRKSGAWQVNSHNLPFNPSPELRAAVRAFVESRGYEYAGLCKEVDLARNVGRWCATPSSLSGDSARFVVGPVLTDTTYSITFVRKAGSWTPGTNNVPYNVPAALRAQLKNFIEARGYTFAGLCPEIDMNQHTGKWCAYPMLMSAENAEFVVGPVQSSTSYRVKFGKRSGAWTVTSQNVPVNVPDSLRAAIKSLVESRGYRYAGLCLEIDQPNNVGKWCALVGSVSNGTAQVSVGPVLSDSLYAATFAQDGSGWKPVTHKVPLHAPADLRANIKSLIESRGFSYAGLCEQIEQSANYGKACAFIRWESDVRAVVTYGRVATDEIHRAVFEHRAGAWMMVSGDTTPVITPTPTPTTPPANTPTPRPNNPTPTPTPETEEPTEPTPTPTPEGEEPETPTPSPTPDGEEPVVVPQALREAIARYLTSIGVDYLGLCSEIRVGEGATGDCAVVSMQGEGEARVLYGPLTGGNVKGVTFVEYAGEWLAVGAPSPEDDDDSGPGMASFLLIGLAGIGVTGLGAGIYAARRR